MKNFVKFFVGGLISLLLVVLLSCGEDAGLGSTVDTEAPKLSISYPPAAAYVRGEFVFAGTCSDDKGVTRVEVTVKNLDTGKTYDTVLAKIENSLTWRININKQTASGFELSDGKYMLEATAYDKSGRSSGTSSRQFDIDNTPPVFVITKPGIIHESYLSKGYFSKYGSLFAIEGTIADDHSIASMDVSIYDKDGNPVSNEPYSEKEISTTGGTSVTIARFIESGVDDSNKRYNDIYSVGDADSEGNKIYSCTVTIADSTKEYKNPGDNGTEGGNSTSVVYLYNDIYDEYMSAKKGAGLSANDFRTVLNGTATDESLSGKGVATDVTVEKVRAALKKFEKDTTNIEDNSLSFSLNPNADPTYNISGFNLNYNEAGTAIAAGTNKAMGEQPLTVIVSQGLDNILIDPTSLKVYIKKIIDADKAHITKNALNKSISDLVTKVSELEIDLANASESSDTEKQKEAEAQLSVIDGWNLLHDNSNTKNVDAAATVTLSLTLPANNYIEANAYYAIVVTGQDKDGIKLSQAKNFGFMGTISAVQPTASFTSPADNQFFANSKAETLSFTGTATENNAGMTLRKITAILTASDESTGKEVDGKVEVTIEGNSDKIWENVPGLSCYYDEAEKTNKWTFTPALCNGYDTLKAEEEGLQYAYKATIKVTGTGELTTETSRIIKIDTKKPVVAITSVTPVVSGKEYFGEDSQYKDYTFINSTISIQGSITENNLSSVTYDVRASADLNADLSDEKYSILAGLKEFSEKNGEIVVDGDLGTISSIEQKFHTDLITNYLIASKQISKDQPVKARIVLRAKDLVGNVGEYNSSESNEGKDFFVYQETDRPKVTLGNSELSYKVGETTKSLLVDEKDENKGNINYEHNLFGTTNNNKLSLSFTDDDSVVEYDIFIAKNGKDFAKDENGNEKPNYTATPNKTSASVNFVLPEEEGVYKVKVVARDFIRTETKTDATQVYGVQVIGPFYIAVDSGAPTLNLSNPQNGGFVSRANGVDEGVKGTVTKREGTTISGFIYATNDTTKKHLIELTDVKINDKPVNGVYEWTGKISKMPATGDNFKFEINAMDVYEQSSTIIVNLGIDEKAPTVKVTLDEDENFTKNKQILETNSNYSVKAGKKRYLVNGTWGDSYTDANNAEVKGTGTKDLYYACTTTVDASGEPVWGEAQKVAGTAESTAETSFNIYLELTNIEGSNFAYKVWGKDKAGNESKPNEADGTLVKGITVDLSVPTIEKTSGAVPQYIKKDGTLTISGQAEDSYGLKEIIAKVKLNGADIASGNKGYTFTPVIAENKKSGTFTIELAADDENNGAWTFEIHAVDLAGRESGTLNYNTVVDTIAPVWNEDRFEVNKAAYESGTDHTWYRASSLPFAGAYTEAGSGIEHVDYKIKQAGKTTEETGSFGTSKDALDSTKESFSTNLGEFIAKMEAGSAIPNTVTFVAVDKAGNESEEQTIEIYIDTEAPSLTESNKQGSQYSNKEAEIKVTGKATDDSSGIKSIILELVEDGTSTVSATVEAISSDHYANWTATITKNNLSALTNGKTIAVKVIIEDNATNKSNLTLFRINVDVGNPTVENISMVNTSQKFKVYATKESVEGYEKPVDTYYVNTTEDNKFSIYGAIQDEISGIDTIKLMNGTTELASESSLPLKNIDFSGLTSSAILTIEAKDNAGNVTNFPVQVKIDNDAPRGIHAIDGNNKDIFFRIGDYNSDSAEITSGIWNDSIDKDVGGKYSSTSYQNNQTVRVRGNIHDDGSGVDVIYYKVINSSTEILQNDTSDANGTVKGLLSIADDFLKNYEKDNNGYFRANSEDKKRVTYTPLTSTTDNVYDMDAASVNFETAYKDFAEGFGSITGKNYATVTTNYDNAFTGFADGYNYLILVAVDNVGNAALDTVTVVTGANPATDKTAYSNFSLNVDTKTPSLKSTQSRQLFTNFAADIDVDGTFDDNFSGVKSIKIEVINDNTNKPVGDTIILNSDSTSGFDASQKTWSATIKSEAIRESLGENPGNVTCSVKTTVTDNAGNEWSQSIFSIQVDMDKPTISNAVLSQVSSDYKVWRPDETKDEYYANPSNGTFKIEGVAMDNVAVSKVELSINGVTHSDTKGSFKFEGIDLTSLASASDPVTATLKVTDSAGNSAEKQIKINILTTLPSLSTEGFKINSEAYDTGTSAKNWYKDSLLTFEGKFTVGICGIDRVDYKIIKAGTADETTGSFATNAQTDGTETFKANLSEFIAKAADTTGSEYNEVSLVAVDKIGNKSAAKVCKIYIDTEAPTIMPSSTDTILTNPTSTTDLTVTGTVIDNPENAAGVKSIDFSIKIGNTEYKSTDTNPKITGSYTGENWTATIKKEVFDGAASGSYTVYATAIDNAGSKGNSQTTNVAVINFDTTPPTVSLNAPSDALKSTPNVIDINKTISLSGNVEDNNPLPANGTNGTGDESNTVTAIEYSTDYNESSPSSANWTSVSTLITSGLSFTGNYSFAVDGFDTTKFTDETTYHIRAKAVDKAGNIGYSNVVSVYVNQRSDRPILNFTNLSKNAAGDFILKLNDAGTVEGTVTDDDSTNTRVVKSLIVQELQADGSNNGDEQTLTVTTSGDFTFTPATKNDGAKYFKFTVIDNKDETFSSNSGTSDYLTVPVLVVKGDAIAEADVASKAFTYKADNEAPVVDSVGATASDTDKDVVISSAYIAGGTKRSTVTLKIKATDANGIAGMTAVIKKPDGTVWKQYKSTSEAKLAGKDLPTANTWEKAGSFTENNTKTEGYWELPSLSLGGINGTVSLVITPYDNSGLTGNSTQQFTVDNEGPSVKVISHKNASEDSTVQYNGIVELSGEAKDANDVTSVKWYIPSATEKTGWDTLDKETLTWNGDANSVAFKFDFKDTTLLDNYIANAISSGTEEPKYYIIPIYFRAVDILGNIKYTTDYSIKFNPDLDKPVSGITYPLTGTGTETTTLGGTIRMTGTAVIPEGAQAGLSVQAVYVQMGNTNTFEDTDRNKAGSGSGNYGYTVVSAYDVINELDKPTTPYTSENITDAVVTRHGFADKAALNVWWGVKTTTTGWRLNLNENGEMNPTGGETNKVYLRACAVNTNGKFGSWSDPQYIAITKSAPGMSGKLYQFQMPPSSTNVTTVTTEAGNVIGEKDYVSGMFLKGQWYIETTATETTTGSKVSVEGVTKDNDSLTKGTDYFVTSDKDATVKVYIKVDPNATKETVYKVTAIDGSGLYSAVATYAVNVDNTAPSVYALTSDYDRKNLISMTKVENSNYVYKIYGAGIDEGSNIDFLAVYFKRGDSIEIPLSQMGTKDGNVTSVTAGTAYKGNLTDTEDGLYGIKDSSFSYSSSNGLTTITSSAITTDNSFIRVGSLVKISGSYYEIKSVGSGSVTVEATFSTKPASVFFVAAIAVNNGTETGNTSAGTTNITNDDGDGFADSLEKTTSGSFKWDLDFYSDELDDGQLDIVVVAGDNAGNYTNTISTLSKEMSATTETKTTVMLTNHKPRVSKVFIATDLNGDGMYKEEDFAYTVKNNGVSSIIYAHSALDDSGNEQKVANLNMGEDKFSVRSGLAVTFEMLGASNGKAARTGGGTALYYIPKLLAKDSSDLSNPATGATTAKFADMSGTAAGKISVTTSAEKVSSTNGFVLSNTDIKKVPGWNDSMENSTALDTQSVVQVTIWDDVNNKKTVGTEDTVSDGKITAFGNQYTIINIPVYFDTADNVAPKSVINPFYWTDAEHNSLYENNSANGHIELEDDWKLTSAYTENENANPKNAEYDGDPKVSGKITLSGYAYDDQRLSSLWIAFDNFTPESYLTTDGDAAKKADNVQASDGKYVVGGVTYYQAAYYTPSTGWTPATANMASNNWEFSVTDTSDDANEIYLSQKGHRIKWTLSIDTAKCSPIVATDINARVIAFDHDYNVVNVTTAALADDNKPAYQMDVVPYITEIKNKVGDAYKKDASVFGRSATGAYPVYYYSGTNYETFTVNGFNFGSSPSVSVNGGTATTGNTVAVTSAMTSGKVVVTVGSGTSAVSSLNNVNNNNAKGSYDAENTSGYDKYKNYYNRQPNNVNNSTLTDDCKVAVWNVKQVVSDTSITYPTMRVSTGTGNPYVFIYDSGKGQTNGASSAVKAYKSDYNNSQPFEIGYSYSQWFDTGAAIDKNGNIYGSSQNGDTGGDGNAMYIGNYSNNIFFAKNIPSGYDNYGRYQDTRTWAYNSTRYGYAIESGYYEGQFYPTRVRNPKIATDNNNALYMTYYDSATREVRFRYGTGPGDNGFANHGNSSSGDAYHTLESGDNAGEYTAVGATTDGEAIVVYYNSDKQGLYYTYNTTPTDKNEWTKAVEIDTEFVGWYVDLVVDGENGVHIAYYDASNGDLKYAYIQDYTNPSVVKTMTVDSYLSSGTNISISVKKVGSDYVPYISSFMSSFNKTSYTVRTAWITDGSLLKSKTADELKGVDGNDDFTGVWEVMTVPLASTSIPLDYSVGIGIKSNQPILGYGTQAGLETATLK